MVLIILSLLNSLKRLILIFFYRPLSILFVTVILSEVNLASLEFLQKDFFGQEESI
jgi:hypothetical protein